MCVWGSNDYYSPNSKMVVFTGKIILSIDWWPLHSYVPHLMLSKWSYAALTAKMELKSYQVIFKGLNLLKTLGVFKNIFS